MSDMDLKVKCVGAINKCFHVALPIMLTIKPRVVNKI